MAEEYTHMQPGERIESVSGHYTMEKEFFVEHEGRRVLVMLGHTIIDSACCGAGGCRYAFVPGYVRAYRTLTGASGAAVSLVEPVADPGERDVIEQLIHSLEIVQQVLFG